MQVTLITVGRPSRLVQGPLEEYETRAGRYWKLGVVEIRADKSTHSRPVTEVRQAEGARLRAAVPAGADMVALTRAGDAWTSEKLAAYLEGLAVAGAPGAAFLIGGAHGLDRQLVRDARHRVSLSSMTMPHDLARLIFAEQLYRAGTIVRGEPYHKG